MKNVEYFVPHTGVEFPNRLSQALPMLKTLLESEADLVDGGARRKEISRRLREYAEWLDGAI